MKKLFDLRVHLPRVITSFFPAAVWRMPTGDNKVYLTFDDGPIPQVTPQVLDILKRYNIKATFFCVGDNIRKHPHIFQRIVDEGHMVGNHTFNHIQGVYTKNAKFFENVELCNTYTRSNLFRPPHGLLTRTQYRRLSEQYRIIMWDVISCDYDPLVLPERCFRNVKDFVREGSIITFHDSLKSEKNVLEALPKVIEYIHDLGYTFELINYDEARPMYHKLLPDRIATMIENRRVDRNLA